MTPIAVDAGLTTIAVDAGLTTGLDAEWVSSKTRVTWSVPAADQQKLATDYTGFAFDLYRQVAKTDGGNVIVSPVSAYLALAMLSLGAKGQTAQAMADGLHYTLPPERLFPALSQMDATLNNATVPGGELRLANQAWVQRGLALLPSYLGSLGEYFGAGVVVADFAGAPEKARVDINNWVLDKTHGLITDLLPPDSIDGSTLLVLANALYFAAPWAVPFLPENGQQGLFHGLDGTQRLSDFMTEYNSNFRAADSADYQAVLLDFKGGARHFLIVMPKGDFLSFEASFAASDLSALMARITQWSAARSMTLWLPKFSFMSDYDLREALTTMGMGILFGAPDLSGILGQPIYVSKVITKGLINLDENGVKAAAATAIYVVRGMQSADFLRIDRPFLFFIYDDASSIPLFMGRVVSL